MKGLITICARGGSKGVPGKNVKEVNGLPLIAYSINIAKKFQQLHNCDIEISSDSDHILEVSSKYGVNTNYKRPNFLATDKAGKGETIQDLVLFSEKEKSVKYDYILDLDVSSPIRTLNDLEEAFENFKKEENCLTLFSVNEAAKNPYFNMVEQDENGYYKLSKKIGLIKSRQEAPRVFQLNASFYFYRREYFNQEELKVINDRSLIYNMSHICFDIDEPLDFEFFKYLMENNKLDLEI